jgi:hypothetical protein
LHFKDLSWLILSYPFHLVFRFQNRNSKITSSVPKKKTVCLYLVLSLLNLYLQREKNLFLIENNWALFDSFQEIKPVYFGKLSFSRNYPCSMSTGAPIFVNIRTLSFESVTKGYHILMEIPFFGSFTALQARNYFLIVTVTFHMPSG